MGFFRDKLLDLFVDESVDKLKQGITPIQYQKKLEDAKQSLKDFLLEYYGKRWDYNEIDQLVSNHAVISQLIYWILEEDISVYQEIERFASTIDDTSLLKSEIISILMDLYKIAYEELAQIDNPELKGVVIRVSRQLQRLYDEAGKQLESVCQKGEEIQNSLEGIKAILQEYPLPSNIDIESILMQAFSIEKEYNPSIDYKQASEELIPTIDFNYSDITVISKEKRIMSIEEVFSHNIRYNKNLS